MLNLNQLMQLNRIQGQGISECPQLPFKSNKQDIQNWLSYTQNSFIQQKIALLNSKQNIIISDRLLAPLFIQQSPLKMSFHQQVQYYNKNEVQSQYQQAVQMKKIIETSQIDQLSFSQKQHSHFNPLENSLLDGDQTFSHQQEHQIEENQSIDINRKNVSIGQFQLNHKEYMNLGLKILSGLQKNIVSLPFRQPIDVIALEIPDYLEIVKQPMDLRTIKKNLSEDFYKHITQIYDHIQLIISNSFKYNELNPDFIKLTKNFQKSYLKIRKTCQRNIKKIKVSQDKKYQNHIQIDHRTRNNGKKSQKVHEQVQKEIQSSFQFSQLAQMAKKIRKLTSEQQIQLFKNIGIVDTLTIDLKTLSTKQVRLLIRYVDKLQAAKTQHIILQQKRQHSSFTTFQGQVVKSNDIRRKLNN